MKKSRTLSAAAGITLLIAASVAQAYCYPNNCWQRFQQCRAAGGTYANCWFKYEDCLAQYNCPAP